MITINPINSKAVRKRGTPTGQYSKGAEVAGLPEAKLPLKNTEAAANDIHVHELNWYTREQLGYGTVRYEVLQSPISNHYSVVLVQDSIPKGLK